MIDDRIGFIHLSNKGKLDNAISFTAAGPRYATVLNDFSTFIRLSQIPYYKGPSGKNA